MKLNNETREKKLEKLKHIHQTLNLPVNIQEDQFFSSINDDGELYLKI